MTEKSYNEALFEEEARVAAIYPIGMMGDTENPPEWLTEVYEACSSPNDKLFTQLPELHPQAADIYEWSDSLFAAGRSGFIVRFETCVRKYMKPPATAWHSGWGNFYFRYIYVESVDQIGPDVLAAVRALHEADRRKVGAA